jgi:hypothetical protein
MVRKMLATAFVLALSCLAPLSGSPQTQAANRLLLTANPQVAAACTAHVCALCVESGLACTSIPYCHCF